MSRWINVATSLLIAGSVWVVAHFFGTEFALAYIVYFVTYVILERRKS